MGLEQEFDTLSENDCRNRDKSLIMPEELPQPPAAATATQAMEMARVWIVDKSQHVVISPNLWKEPGAWGVMLVDLANHVANAYAKQGYDREQALEDIKQAFDAEWRHSTE